MTYAEAIVVLVDLDIGTTLRAPGALYSETVRSPDGYDVGPFDGLALSAAAEALSGMDAPDPDSEGTAF